MTGRKRKISFSRNDSAPLDHQLKKSKANVGGSGREKYVAAGLKSTIHGNVYQLKLLMLFLWRGIQEKYSFALATEMVAAEKFDDVVFRYEDRITGDKVYRFLQAKHKQDESKKITIHDLETENDDDFSLQKYFISYRKIKLNPTFNGYKLRDFVICSNIDLDEELKSSFELVEEEDNILTFITMNKECERLKFKNSFPQKDRIFSLLQDTSERFRLAKKLATCIILNQRLELRDDLFKSYHYVLVEEILDRGKKDGKEICVFKTSFINGSNLAPEVKAFRKTFHKAYLNVFQQQMSKAKLSKAVNDNLFISELNFFEKMKEIQLNSSSTFGKKSKDPLLKTSFPDDEITNDEINFFLNDLVLAVNQPNELKLSDIIEVEMSEGENINLIDTEFMVNQLQRDLLDWMKEKEGRFLTHEEGEALFQKIEQKISKLVVIGQTIEHYDKVESYCIDFSKNFEELDYFLDSPHEQIFNIITNEENITLSSIKVHQTLKKNKVYQKNDSYIFMKLNSLLLKRIYNHVIAASKSTLTNNLLVVECGNLKESIQKVNLQLCYIINLYERMRKKVILVTQENHDLVEQIRNTFSKKSGIYIEKKDKESSLIDLTEDSQKKLLEESKIIFQGEEMILGRLMANAPETLLKNINGELITKFINKEDIKIGELGEDRKYDQVKDCYIVRTFYRHEKITEHFKDDASIFVVDDICKLPSHISHPHIVVISNTESDFEYMCEKYGGHQIHWLEKNVEGFSWKKSCANDLSKLRKFVDISEGSVKKYEPQNIMDITDKVVIIAAEPGMGKSVTLSHLAINTRSVPFQVWIVKCNSADYLKFEAWGKNETSNRVMDAVRFLYEIFNFQIFENFNAEDEKNKKGNILKKLLIIHNKEITFNLSAKCQNGKVLLKNGKEEECAGSSKLVINGSSMMEIELFTHYYNQGQIILLFDGFDEISPTYKDEVIQLLQTLQKTKIKKIWITTRSYNNIQTEIENELGMFSYSFKPFNVEEQKMFLKKFWDKSLEGGKLNEDRFNTSVHKILYKFYSFTNDHDTKFISIPLQLYMIANIFKETFKMINDSDEYDITEEIDRVLGNKLDLVNLYEEFIKEKIGISIKRNSSHTTYHISMRKCIDKIHLDAAEVNCNDSDEDDNDLQETIKVLLKSHETLAVHLLLSEPSCEKKIKHIQKLKDMIRNGKEKTGIIDKIINNEPEFIHLNFAEYLAANYLWKQFKSIQINGFENFIQDIIIGKMIESEKVQLSEFFQLIAIKNLNDRAYDSAGMIDKLIILLKKLIELQKGRIKKLWNCRHPIELFLKIFELSSLLDCNDRLICDNIIDSTDQYSLLCLCVRRGNQKIAKAILNGIETETLQLWTQHYTWMDSPLCLAAFNRHLKDLRILVIKYSDGIRSWKDVEGKFLIQQIMQDPEMYWQLLELLDGDTPYSDFEDNKQKLPIIEAFFYHLPEETICLLTENSNLDAVNKFTHSVASKEECNQSLHSFLEKYNDKMLEYVVKNGMDFSKAMYSCIFNSAYTIISLLEQGTDVYYIQPISQISQKIDSLLKCGTGYNYKDLEYKVTTFEVIEQIHKIYSMLNAVYIKYKNDESSSPLDTILSMIIENTEKYPNFNGYNILIQSGQISLSPKYNYRLNSTVALHSQEFSQEIHFLPQYVTKLVFKSYIQDTTQIRSYLEKLHEFVKTPQKILKINDRNLEGRKLIHDIGCGNLHNVNEEPKLDEPLKDLIKQITRLHEKQNYTIDDALLEVEKTLLKIDEVMKRLLLRNKKLEDLEEMRNVEEILQIFDIKSWDTGELQEFTTYGIHLLIKIWSCLNNTGQKKIMNIIENMIKLLEPFSSMCGLFEKLDKLYKALIDTIKTENYSKMNKILEANCNFIKAVINGQDDEFGSPLHYAAYKGDLKTIESLLKFGANPILRLNEHAKLELLSTNTEEIMVGEGYKDWNYENWSSLHLAALNGNDQVVEKLIEYGAKIDATIYVKTIHEGETALHASALSFCGHSKSAQLLLEKGAQYDIRNIRDKTPLDLAKPGSDIKKLLNYIDELFKAVEDGETNLFHSLLEENDGGKIKAILKARNTNKKTLIQETKTNELTFISNLLEKKLKSVEINDNQ